MLTINYFMKRNTTFIISIAALIVVAVIVVIIVVSVKHAQIKREVAADQMQQQEQAQAMQDDENNAPATTASAGSGYTYSINGQTVSLMKKGSVVQTIKLGADAMAATKIIGNSHNFITNQDVNFDGHADLAVLSSIGYGGTNVCYSYYLLNPLNGTLVANSSLSDVCGQPTPIVDSAAKEIKAVFKSGSYTETQIYKYQGNSNYAVQTAAAAQ